MNDDRKEPLFNAGIEYTKQVSEKVKEANNFLLRGMNLELSRTLTCLHILVLPRMSQEQKDRSIKAKKACSDMALLSSKHPSLLKGIEYRGALEEWFSELNSITHECGLSMPDKGTGAEAARYV